MKKKFTLYRSVRKNFFSFNSVLFKTTLIFLALLLTTFKYSAIAQNCYGYNWATWTNQGNTNTATSTIDNNGQLFGLTLTSNYNIFFTGGIFNWNSAFSGFPDRPPNTTVPATNFGAGGVTTICFSQPVTNPVLLFSSLGASTIPVTVSFSAEYSVIYTSGNMTYINDTCLRGAEGYCVIVFPGTFTCISAYTYSSEIYQNFTWGIQTPLFPDFGYTHICPGIIEFHDSTTQANFPASISNWRWDFGDGYSSTEQNPSHIYLTAGNYNVSLVVTFFNGCKDTITHTLTVDQIPSVTNPQTICQGQTYTINGHTYSTPGAHLDTFAIPGGCDSVFVTMLTVTPLPSIGNHTISACSGVPFIYAPVNAGFDTVPAGTTYSWAAPNVPGITGTAAGNHASGISGTLTNTTNSAINVPYIVTPINANCPGDTFKVNVLVNPMPSIADTSISLCSGGSFLYTPAHGINGIVPTGTTYSWPNPNIAGITGDAAGSNAANIGATLTNTTNAPINVVYTVTPKSGNCTGTTFSVTVTVNPRPAVTNITNTICSGDAFTITPTTTIVPSNTTYTWAAPVVAGITGAAAGANANTISGTLTNTTTANISVVYTVTPTAGSCSGNTFTVTINVTTKPDITNYSTSICSGSSFSFTPVNGTDGIVPATTRYNWPAPVVAGITGAASGTNATSVSGTLTNTTNAPITVTYVVTPNAGTCIGDTFSVTVTVNPKPAITMMYDTICSGQTFSVIPANSVNGIVPAGTTYSWPAPNVASVTGEAAGTNASTISGTLVNTTNAAANVAYTVTPSAGTCNGTAFTVSVYVKPVPSINNMSTTVCSGNSFTVTPVNTTNGIVPAGTSYSWTAPVLAGITGTAAGNNAANISGTLTNTTNAAINVVYIITPSTGTCIGDTFTVSVTVNPGPSVNNFTTSICSGAAFSITPVNGTDGMIPAGTTYSWPSPNVAQITGEAAGTNLAAIGNTLTNTTNSAVNIVYTVTPKWGSCTGAPFTVTVAVDPKPAVANITNTICSGDVFTVTPTTTIVPANTIYSWAAPVVAGITGTAAGANANTISGTLTNTTNANISVIYTVTPTAGSCTGNAFTVTINVNPKPSNTNYATSICSGNSFLFTPVNGTNGIIPAITRYNWPAPAAAGITGAASATNATNITGTLTNTTNAPITVTYVVTPSAGTCIGDTFSVSVTVNPKPVITSIYDTICSGQTFTVTPVNAVNGTVPAGTTYSWPIPNVAAVTGEAAGTNAANISGTLVNTTNAAANVPYTITPSSGTCTGTIFTVNIYVKPVPAVNNISAAVCSGNSFTVTPVNITNGIVPAGTTYSWTAPVVAGITGTAAGNNAANISGTLTNTTNAAINVVYIITPSTGTCIGDTFTVSVTVNPGPSVNNFTTSICSGAAFLITPVNGTDGMIPAGTTYSWPSPNVPEITGEAHKSQGKPQELTSPL